MSARGDLSFDQVKSQLQQAAAQQSVTDYQTWLSHAVKKADVSVDPQWGSWNSKTGVVVAPVGATTSIGSKPRTDQHLAAGRLDVHDIALIPVWSTTP